MMNFVSISYSFLFSISTSISINEGVAAVIRCPRSHVEDAKKALIFEESISPSIHGRLPTLPYMEFEDFDGNVKMSPMKLHWENAQAKGRPMQVREREGEREREREVEWWKKWEGGK